MKIVWEGESTVLHDVQPTRFFRLTRETGWAYDKQIEFFVLYERLEDQFGNQYWTNRYELNHKTIYERLFYHGVAWALDRAQNPDSIEKAP